MRAISNALAFLCCAAAAQAEVCEPDPIAFMAAAKQEGFKFQGTSMSEATTADRSADERCVVLLDDASLMASAPRNAEQKCSFTLFYKTQGQQTVRGTLSASWTVESIDFLGAAFVYTRRPARGAHSPYVVIELLAPKGDSKVVSLSELRLKGPSCTDWRDALRAGNQ